MVVISRRQVIRAASAHYRGKALAERWHDVVTNLSAGSLEELQRTFPSAAQVGNTVVFKIAGNNYRLLCCVDWVWQRLFFRAFLPRDQYDRMNVEDLCP
ncbi:MAG: type II toxin-antitoxin system HigB family toxin [Acidobacteria bacterium]|nr:type II toxin-antitoxin system HigB family toxin [Acidobacteriota bacterium]